MAGHIVFEKDRGRYRINWRQKGKLYIIRKWRGEFFWSKRHAEKCRSIMQGEVERKVFRIESYLGDVWTDTVPYLNEWLDSVSLMPATYKTYRAAATNHLIPFFTEHAFQLHEIQLDTVTRLLRYLQEKGLSPKYTWNIVNTLHACLNYAYRSNRIERMPAFPKKGEYHLQAKAVEWLTEDRQVAVIEAIPLEHQPIFWWLKYHYRRPGEAYALNREDYDADSDCFIIRRSTSARRIVNRTKTGATHIVPCDPSYHPFLHYRNNADFISPAFFNCKSARNKDKRYTDTICHKLWKDACKKVGESIKMYDGLKHSSCTQFLVEKGGTEDELQLLTDHANRESIKHYAGAVLARKRAAMNRLRIIPKRVQNESK